MSHSAIIVTPFGHQETRRETPTIGAVDPDRPAAFPHLKGRTIRCTSGHLWITLENDAKDHVIRAGRSLSVAAAGKVIIGGRGSYRIEPTDRMSLAS